MKFTDLHGMSPDQLGLTLADTEKQLFILRFQSATDRLETPSEIKKAKKDIARIKTEQRRRELALLGSTAVDKLPDMLATLHAKTDGPGKRRIKRQIARLETVRAGVVATVQVPTKGK